jgi:hypothetical protein
MRGPRKEEKHSDADGANWVKKPVEVLTHDGHDEPKDTDDDVVAVVDVENVNGWRLLVEETVHHKDEFEQDWEERE